MTGPQTQQPQTHAVVTGAAQGIGAAVAVGLVDAGRRDRARHQGHHGHRQGHGSGRLRRRWTCGTVTQYARRSTPRQNERAGWTSSSRARGSTAP